MITLLKNNMFKIKHRHTIMNSKPSNRITVFGAGIAGLVAAINLARSGFEVTVKEKRNRIGGSSNWHPSVHQQTFNLEKTSEYIAIDIKKCFNAIDKHTFYFFGRRSGLVSPPDSYICEKGPQPTSLESHLYSIAIESGVEFVFNMDGITDINDKSEQCIIATGLEPAFYQKLGIKHVSIQGFKSCKPANMDSFILSFFGDYTKNDFAYIASSGRYLFALLFARNGIDKNDLNSFRAHIKKNENLSLSDWSFSKGCIPREKNLVKNGFVLAGTISGMIDPFFFNGISAALISGKIASLYFTDREMAFREFNRFTRNFYSRKILKSLSEKLPLKKFSFPLIVYINNHLKWVGVI